MAIIPLGYSEGDASIEELAKIRLRNMYLTENRYSPDKLARFTRPTLTSYLNLGISPIYGVFFQYGSLDNYWFVVSGETLYKIDSNGNATVIGNIPGTGICQFAGTIDKLVIVRSGYAYSTDGTTIHTIAMPDGRLVGSVCCIDGSFLLSQKDYYRFYWLRPGESDPDPLSFASAERSPDGIVGFAILSDEIWIIGQSNIEVWQTTGDLDAPYVRIAGRVYSYGCVDANTIYTTSYQGQPCAIWVTEKRSVVMGQGATQIISTKAVENILQTATNFRSYGFRWNQHEFYVLTTDQKTLVFNLNNQTWSTFDSYSYPNWRAHVGFQLDEDVYCGDAYTGTLWKLDSGYSDDGEKIVREVSGFLIETSSKANCFSVNVRINAGWAPGYSYTPVLEMRFSDDYGFSWSPYYQVQMGKKGAYDYDVTYRSLGTYQRPGREFEFRFSDIAKFRVDYATINEV